MDSRERDKFYSKSDDDDDDADYELEPPDEEITAEAERRGREAIEASRADIDIDEIYRDAGQQRSDEILEGLLKNFKLRFRFQTSHLLILTAVLAIVLTLARLQMLGVGVFLLIVCSVAGLFFYLQIQERKAEEEATRRREEMYARRRAQMLKPPVATRRLPLLNTRWVPFHTEIERQLQVRTHGRRPRLGKDFAFDSRWPSC